ncbi:hypothetical protein F5887DRAFT_1251225 [Amanita rubescens]|nr:hypothetical protein F5887DRAFT_1251225 [Amanita rubescens]
MAEHNAPVIILGLSAYQPLTLIRELWMQKDKEQCDSWKDEVQNILIFSGLFSAIVTAFLIESQKALRPDPAQESVQLLRQIAAQSAGQNLVGTGAEPPTISVYVVNAFWFLSLVLSLTVALIGIVSLQWIRTHMSILSDGSESLGFSHMHSLGLRKSYIPLIFTSLPVILLVGLTFFLVGLVVFLFELSWPVATPAAIAIGLTFAFLLTTTLHPGIQPFLEVFGANRDCFPSSYRSPQSLLLLRQRDWTSRSQFYLRKRRGKIAVDKQLSHLGKIDSPVAYDTIKALDSVKESRSAESEKERTALAKCLAEVLPIYLGRFPTRDLADLIPFLPPSEFVPSALFSRDSATREDLSTMALVQIATCLKRPPPQTSALVEACILTTRWLFERPRTFDSVPIRQPLYLISKPDELSPDVLGVLIGTLIRFFSFARDFHPDSQSINKTTHTSSYTYWFLVRSAEILTGCSLSNEMQARHGYLLTVITNYLNEGKGSYYLFLTASIYASTISQSSAMCSSSSGREFLRVVTRHPHRDGLKDDLQSQLHGAMKANEVAWGCINLAAFGSSDAASVPNAAGANGTVAEHRPISCAYDGDPTLGEGRELGGLSRDRTTQGAGIPTLEVHASGEGSSQRTSPEGVNSSGSGRNLDGEGYQGKLDVVIDEPPST